MKIILILVVTFLLSVVIVFGQTTDNNLKLDSIYQNFLNNERFVKDVLKDTSYLCKGNLLLIQDSIDYAFSSKLTFRGRQIAIGNKNSKCPTISFSLVQLGYNYQLFVSLTKVDQEYESPQYFVFEQKYYSQMLVKSGKSYKAKKIIIGKK